MLFFLLLILAVVIIIVMATKKGVFPFSDPLLSAGRKAGRLTERAYEDVRDGSYLLAKSAKDIVEAPFRKTKNPWKDNAKKYLSSASSAAQRGIKATGSAIRKGSKRAAPVISKGLKGAASRLDKYAMVENPPARKPPLRPMSKEDQQSVIGGVNKLTASWPSTIKVPANTLMGRKLMERSYKATKKDPSHLSVPKFRLGWTVLSMIRGVDKEDHEAADEIVKFLETKSQRPINQIAVSKPKKTAKKSTKKAPKKTYLPGM